MNNMNEYRKAYDGLAFSPEQKAQIAANAAMAAAEQTVQHKQRRRLPALGRVAAVAVCMLSALTISADAMGVTTPVSEILAPIFGGTVAQTEIIDQIGRPIDASDTDNGVTISADAIIGDEYNVCLIFTISRDDGTALLPEGIVAQRLQLGGFCDVSMFSGGGAHGTAWMVDTVPGDGEIQYIYQLSADVPLNKGTAKVEFDDLCYWDNDSEQAVPVVEGHWEFRFDVNYEDTSVHLGDGETFEQYGMTFTITDISVSPIAVQVYYEVDSEVQWSNAPSGQLPEADSRQIDRYLQNVQILLVKKDGTVIDLSNAGGSIDPEDGKTYCTKGTVLDEIVPLEELESISVGGVVYDVHAG